jgi:hypothetical protein
MPMIVPQTILYQNRITPDPAILDRPW